MSLSSIKAQHDISIVVHLLGTAERGRRGPTPGSQWSCRLKVRERFHDARLTTHAQHFEPGTTTEADVKFLNWAIAREHIRRDDRVEIWELRLVGTGTVRSVRAEV